MIDQFHHFAKCVMARPNPFNVAAAIYYIDNHPNRIFQALMVIISLTVIALSQHVLIVAAIGILYLIGQNYHNNCEVCAPIQGLGLILFSIGTALGSIGLIAALIASIIYLIPFATWYLLAKRVYDSNYKKPVRPPRNICI